ncbi:MAG TPA: protein kinase, partial [Planctomycetaceae bacterium]|nr:protein kinase [Planctomycetaceae bacterium]
MAERIAAMGDLSMDLAGTVAIASAETSRTGDPPTPPVSSLPASLGGYRVERILGQGGMGAVCLAHDERLGRMVALKTMKPEIVAHPGAKDRFLREARAAAQVEHDNIIPVWQVGEDAGIPFIAMPLMQGESLACRLERERVSPLWVILKVGREVAEGLTAAHAHGLIHRDIKPGNVWLEGDLKATDPAARFRRCKILDFGLVLPAHDDTHLTASGITVGTPAYMSPEQAAGHALDFRTDLFSLGVLLYRMATGDQPFAGPSAMAVLTRLAVHNPPHPATKNPVVPTAVSDLIMRLLAKDPAGRPESARDVATTLRQIARERAATRKTGSAAPVTCPPPPEADAVPVTAAGNMVSDPGTEAFSPQLVTAPVGRRVRSDNTWKWMAAALLAVAAVVAAGVVIIKITGPDGKETTIEVPDGSIVKVDPKGRVDLELPKDAKTPAKPAADLPPQDSQAALRPASADLDRSVAEWVLERGGKVYLKGHGRPVAATRDLPTGPFILIRVMLEGLGDKVTDAGLERLTGLTGLTHLSLARTAVTDAALEHIKELVTLNDLRLGKTEVTDAGLKHLKGLKELTNLSLIQNPGVTGAGLAHLRGLDQLHELDLDATKVTDAGLTHLKGLSRLSHLGLVGTAVTDAGLTHLKGLSRLSHLGLMGTALTDAGLDDLRG